MINSIKSARNDPSAAVVPQLLDLYRGGHRDKMRQNVHLAKRNT